MAGRFSRAPCIREKFLKNLPCLKSECQTVISLQNLFLSQSQVSLGNGYGTMIEQFHELDKGKFRVFAVHVVNLSAKCLAEWVTAKVLNFQAVFLLYLFKDYVDSLDCEDCAFLTDQDIWCVFHWLDMSVTFLYMLLRWARKMQINRDFTLNRK